jgi:hypothetical protein
MKMKSWVLWLLVVVFLVSEVFLFSANRQKNARSTPLRKSQQQVEQLQAQLADLKVPTPRRGTFQTARRQPGFAAPAQPGHAVAGREPEVAGGEPEIDAAVARPRSPPRSSSRNSCSNWRRKTSRRARRRSRRTRRSPRNACINNLRQIDAAKQEWALENDKTADAIPTEQDLLPYFKDGVFQFVLPAALTRLARSANCRRVRFPATCCRNDICVTAIFILGFRRFFG